METVIEGKSMWDLFWAYSGFQVLAGSLSVVLGYVTYCWANEVGRFRRDR